MSKRSAHAHFLPNRHVPWGRCPAARGKVSFLLLLATGVMFITGFAGGALLNLRMPLEQVPVEHAPAAPAGLPGIVQSGAQDLDGALDPRDTTELLKHIGEEVTIQGKVVRAAIDERSGMHFLNFDPRPRQGFVAVVFPDEAPLFTDGPPGRIYDQKTVRITGRIELFRDNPQIVLRDPAQITVVNGGGS